MRNSSRRVLEGVVSASGDGTDARFQGVSASGDGAGVRRPGARAFCVQVGC